MAQPQITIRMTAAHYDVTIVEAGQITHFDLAKMTRGERHKIRRLLAGVYGQMQKGMAA